MERELQSFIDIHKNETAWIFGKGPSLDRFDFETAGDLRCGINDLVGLVPGIRYGFCNDNPRNWLDLYKEDQVCFIPKRTAVTCEAFPNCEVVIFDDYHGHNLVRPASEMADELQIRDGTLGSAMQVLYIMGVRKFVCVGIDGGQVHSTRGKWRTELVNEHYKQYNTIKRRFIEGCEELGIQIQFYGGEKQQMKDGYKTVYFTNNTFVRGNPYSEGMTVQLKEHDARDVVYAGKGQIVPDTAIRNDMRTASIQKAIEQPETRKRRIAK